MQNSFNLVPIHYGVIEYPRQQSQQKAEPKISENIICHTKSGAAGFIDWLDASTRTMGAAEALDGDAEWSEALVLVNISPCMASVSV